MDLVVQYIGKQSNVHVAGLILEAHHTVVVGLELLHQTVVGQADAALQGILPGVLHQNGSAVGNLGEPIGTILVHHVVTLVDVGGVDESVVGIHHAAQEIGTHVAGRNLQTHQLPDPANGGGGIAHVGSTGLDSAQSLIIQSTGAHDDVGSGEVVGDGEAHVGQSQPVETIVVRAGAQSGLHVAAGVVGGLAGQIHGGVVDDGGLVVGAVHAGGGHDILIGDGQEVLIGAQEVALLLALGDHGHGLAGVQQSVDGIGGIVGDVVDDDIGILNAVEVSGALSQSDQSALIVDGSLAGLHDGLVGGGLSHDDTVIAAGMAALGKALGVQAGPHADEGAVVQLAVSQRTLGLIHGDDRGALGIGHAVIDEGLGGHVDLDIVAGQILQLRSGVEEVLLVVTIQGDDVALGIEVAILALAVVHGTHQLSLSAGLVVLVHVPGSHIGVGVGVVHATGEQLGLILQHGDLVVTDEHSLGHQAVGNHVLGADIAIHGQLPSDAGGADQHGILRTVSRGHIIPRLGPLLAGRGGLVASQEIPERHLEAVVIGVVGDGADTDGLAQLNELLSDQVILVVGLVGRRAGLNEDGVHTAMDLGKDHGVELVHQSHSVGILEQGLVGLVTVGVIALTGGTGHVLITLHVLLRNDDDEHVGQQFLNIHGFALNVVVLLQIQLPGVQALGGTAGGPVVVAVLAADVAQIGGVILDEVGSLGIVSCHFLGQKRLTGIREARQGLDVNGLVLQQHMAELQNTVDGGILVGVDVGGEHGDTQVIPLAFLQLGQDQIGILLHQFGVLQPAVHGRLLVGNDHVGDVVAVGGGTAHGLTGDVQIGLGVGQSVHIVVQLIDGAEGVIGNDLRSHAAHGLLRHDGVEVEVAADVQIRTAVVVGSAVVNGAETGGVEVAVDVHQDLQIHLTVVVGLDDHLLDVKHLDGLLGVLGDPLIQRAALPGVGELLGVQVLTLAVTYQREADGLCLDGGGQLVSGQGYGNLYGDVLGVLSQRYLPVYRQVGVGICQRFAWSTGVIRQISYAGEGRHREYEGNCQNKREDLRHQAGSSVLHSCLLILLILCYFGS